MKKIVSVLVVCSMMVAAVSACGNSAASSSQASQAASGSVASTSAATSTKPQSQEITVISREDGSGTRGAFIELFGIEEKDSSGKKIDNTIDSADITNSTGVMLTSVAQNESAIGYVSLGSLNDTVKALKIDGADATAENVKSGEYKISRPFNIATKGEAGEVAQDFIDFILSDEGQAVVEENGYISSESAGAFSSKQPSGKLTVGGSSSVTPVMEKLKEAYLKLNPNATVEVQQSDSTSGMTNTIDGVYDIGMASRELKDSELSEGLNAIVIATDGIAVIVNKENSVDDMTADQVKEIYTGSVTDWSELG